ncbi:MAG TPA: glycosyltransferase family 2 protein, partial [Anaerolineales bacterium]|nr:glycosyltransferase family 2 protein [Anaerolineales bacterium]
MKSSRPVQPACTAIVCAYNEEEHLASVLDGMLNASFIEEIIVVDDGSQDRTPEIVRAYERYEKIRTIFLAPNRGKGYAMAEATTAARGDILLFVDADLINWSAEYAEQVLAPVLSGQADMVIGYPFRKSDKWDALDVFHVQRWLAGQRAVWRADLLPIVAKMRPSRFGVETLINMHYRTRHQPIRMVKLEGLLHPIKFEKSPRSQAWEEYVREVQQILRTHARHPLLTIMTYIPDLIEMRAALLAVYGWIRSSVILSS